MLNGDALGVGAGPHLFLFPQCPAQHLCAAEGDEWEWMGGGSSPNAGRVMYLQATEVNLITVLGEQNEYCFCLYRS